jgi:uncharacterized protein involved in exopolysaccharide biosynthesis
LKENQGSSQIYDLLALIKKYYLIFIGLMITCFLAGVIANRLIPKRYKSRVLLSIQPAYFQNPLSIGSDVRDGIDLKMFREMMIRQSLSNDFLDRLSRKYGLHGQSSKRTLVNTQDPVHITAEEMDDLRRRFEIFFINSMTLQVSFVASKAELAYEVVREATERMVYFLQETRKKNILSTKKAIQEILDTMNPTLNHLSKDPVAPDSVAHFKTELAHVEEQIGLFKTVYTPTHPQVKHLEAKAISLKQWLSATDPSQDKKSPETHASVVSNIYEDLLKKWNYLTITLAVESEKDSAEVNVIETPAIFSQPIWPNPQFVMLWALAAGLITFICWVIFHETWSKFK